MNQYLRAGGVFRLLGQVMLAAVLLAACAPTVTPSPTLPPLTPRVPPATSTPRPTPVPTSTGTPTPTPEPTEAGSVTVLQTTLERLAGGGFGGAGLVQNNTNHAVMAVEVQVQLVSVGGKVLLENRLPPLTVRLQPGEIAPFQYTFAQVETNVRNITAGVRAEVAAAARVNFTRPAVVVEDEARQVLADGTIIISGVLANHEAQPVQIGEVQGAAFLERSLVSVRGLAYSFSLLAAGERRPFVIALQGHPLSRAEDALLFIDARLPEQPLTASRLSQVEPPTPVGRGPEGRFTLAGVAANSDTAYLVPNLLCLMEDADGRVLDMARAQFPSVPLAPGETAVYFCDGWTYADRQPGFAEVAGQLQFRAEPDPTGMQRLSSGSAITAQTIDEPPQWAAGQVTFSGQVVNPFRLASASPAVVTITLRDNSSGLLVGAGWVWLDRVPANGTLPYRLTVSLPEGVRAGAVTVQVLAQFTLP